jgi:hypothetical protein
MKKITKISSVIAGFVLAFVGAGLAAYLDDLVTAQFQAQSGGMVAGGEMILFIGVFAFLSLFPIGLALFFLRSEENFWNLFSLFAIALALTGPAAEGLLIAVRVLSFYTHSWFALITFMALLRVFGAFVLWFGFILFAFITRFPKPRRRLLIAAGIETALLFYSTVHFLIWHNFG